MAYPWFESGVASGMASASPNDDYRDMLQAYVDDQWDNTTAVRKLDEQDAIGATTYTEVEAMIANLIDLTSTGKKSGKDFIRVFFRDFGHEIIRGRYYKFNNNYWIVDDVSLYEGVAPLMTLRKCNNSLRIIDPDSGELFSAPCVVGYDMTSPSEQVSRYVITPNNHATITIQANADTMRLFTYNKRFILDGRPFKLLAFQKALLDDLDNQVPTIMYLDLYLDEEHAEDDIANRIADNGAVSIDGTVKAADNMAYLTADISRIRLHDSIRFSVKAKHLGKDYDISDSVVSLSVEHPIMDDGYLSITKMDGQYVIKCNKMRKEPYVVHVVANHESPVFSYSLDVPVQTVSMLG